MMQLRPRGSDDPFYSPERDLAYVTPHLVAAAMRQLDMVNWGYLKDYFKLYNLTESDLGEAARVVAAYINGCTEDASDTKPAQVLERVGFFALPHPAQVAVMYVIGQQYMAAFFVCIRHVTHLGEAPPADLHVVVEAADLAATYMNLPPWRRRIRRAVEGARRRLLRLLGHEPSRVSLPKGPGTNSYAADRAETVAQHSQYAGELPEHLPLPGEKPV